MQVVQKWVLNQEDIIIYDTQYDKKESGGIIQQ